MKKLTIFGIVLCLLFICCSCSKPINPEINSASSDYRNIECDKYENYEYEYFSDKKDSNILRINVPKKWNFEKTEQGYNIVEFSEIIGNIIICDKFFPEGNAQFISGNEVDAVDVLVTHNIYKINEGDETSYRHIFIYEYEDLDSSKNLVINMPYKKVSIDTASKMMNYTELMDASRDNYLGIMRIRDSRKRILIMGNSFIGSSEIGDTLQKMCGTSVIVEAFSRGYAEVHSYAEDEYMMEKIRSGLYSAVFICGFYSAENIKPLNIIVSACKISNTKLAIFPAHNENRSTIKAACEEYSYPVLIDWKAEIDKFINSGIEKQFFCINDMHLHSTPIAGYIGAHMIYRALFGKMPNDQNNYNYVSKREIEKLGDYKTTGCIKPAYDIYSMSQ